MRHPLACLCRHRLEPGHVSLQVTQHPSCTFTWTWVSCRADGKPRVVASPPHSPPSCSSRSGTVQRCGSGADGLPSRNSDMYLMARRAGLSHGVRAGWSRNGLVRTTAACPRGGAGAGRGHSSGPHHTPRPSPPTPAPPPPGCPAHPGLPQRPQPPPFQDTTLPWPHPPPRLPLTVARASGRSPEETILLHDHAALIQVGRGS